MNVYHRNINSKIISLWTISILLIAGVIYFALTQNFLIALLMFGLTIIAGFIRIHGLSISSNDISIRRYYAFGFKKREVIIPPEKFKDITFWEYGDLNYSSSTDTWLDVFYIPALFIAGRKGMTFKSQSSESNMKPLKLYLDNQEYNLAKDLV